ncbi:hypothetical protein Ga0076813_12731, partial [endosymbiont of Ridgeia piscesae]
SYRSLLTRLPYIPVGDSWLLQTTAWMQKVESRMEPLPRFATQKLDILGTRYAFMT